MIKYYIKAISIEGFRGINNQGNPLIIDFQSDGVTSLFGENGKGKSSIFEAIIFSILGRIVRFDSYHGDIKDKKTIKNLFHSGNGNIKITFFGSDNSQVEIDINIDSKGNRIFNSCSVVNPEEFLESLSSDLNFLDYNSFEKIMLQSSEDTGKLFSNLVGFGNFIHIKEKFDKISRTQNINSDFGKSMKENNIRENSTKTSDIKSEVIKKINEIGITTTTYDKFFLVTEIKKFLKKQYSLTAKKIESIDFDKLVQVKIGSKYEENVEKLNLQQESLYKLLQLQTEIKKLTSKQISSLKSKLDKAYSHIATEKDLVLGKMYDDAILSYNIIEKFDKNTCILCESEELGDSKNTFYDQINLKVKNYKRFKDNYTSFSNAYLQHLTSFKVLDFENRLLPENERFFSQTQKKNDYLDRNFFETNPIQNILTDYRSKLSAEINNIRTSIKDLKSQIPPKVSELIEKNNIYKFVALSILEIDKLLSENVFNGKYLAELENWIRFINDIKEDYENSYNILMDEIALMIDSDTKLFFKEIMGNVEITPKLKKENKGQKVTILLEKFYSDTNENKAATLLSESYRNALSLSIYFAAALKSKNSGNFMILDDITSSFDSGHQIFLLDLIKTKIGLSSANKKGKQIILLTHDGTLKKVLNQNGSQRNWTNYNLNSNKDIVSLKPFMSEDLKLIINEKIASGNYIGSDFRMYYEFVLLEIIEKLNLEIPFSLINNNDEKMVAKLSTAIFEIIELKKIARKVEKISALPNKADFKLSTQNLSNNLSHWAGSSTISLTTSVLNRIVDDIDNFKRIFQYNCTCTTRNAGWVYYKSLSSFKINKCTCRI
jgi:DNA repair exonuclease SbcCD ATPase subunit